MKKLIASVLVLFCCSAFAWEGVDNDGNSVHIGKGNLVRAGKVITACIENDCRNVEVQSIESGFSTVEVKVYDMMTGRARTYHMEKRKRKSK